MNMRIQLPNESKILAILRLWYLVGILGFAFPFSFEIYQFLTPFSLLLLVGAFFLYHENRDQRFWVVMLFIAFAGYGIEVAGVMTGKIFGVYSYGKTLGLKIADVPLMIGINWVLMVYGGVAIASLAKLGRIPGSLLAAAIMTPSDFFIEKFAILSDMWSWENTEPPLQNYLSWLIISFIFCLLAYPSIAGKKRKVAIWGYLYQLIFFIVIIIIHKLFWP
jgi:putative membrane protein